MTTQQIQPIREGTVIPFKNSNLLKSSAKKQRILSFIKDDIATLKDNWDGYSAPPIEAGVLSHVEYLINKLPNALIDTFKIESILPNPNGTVSIEWSNNTHELFLEIGNHYSTYYFKLDNKIEFINNHFILSNSVEFRQFIKYLKSYF